VSKYIKFINNIRYDSPSNNGNSCFVQGSSIEAFVLGRLHEKLDMVYSFMRLTTKLQLFTQIGFGSDPIRARVTV
jgi:hypothetical protein